MGRWPEDAFAAVVAALVGGRRALVVGATGCGKSTLAADAAAAAAEAGAATFVLCADPGQPAWGPPAALSLRRGGAAVGEGRLAFVGALDPVRSAAEWLTGLVELAGFVPAGAGVAVDAPGVVRGRAAATVLERLVAATRPAVVVAPGDDADTRRLVDRLAARGDLTVVRLPCPAAATARSKRRRRVDRTRALDAWLAGADVHAFAPDAVLLGGRPPDAVDWPGRLVGLRDATGATITVGEVTAAGELVEADESTGVEESTGAGESTGVGAITDDDDAAPAADPLALRRALRVRAPLSQTEAAAVHSVVIGQAGRDDTGHVMNEPARAPETTPRSGPGWTTPPRRRIHPAIGWPAASGRALYRPRFLNDLFGDPGVLLRHHRTGRTLAFDLGRPDEVPVRLLNATTDVFVSHAHMDHLEGLVALLRARLGPGGAVRLYGPLGLDVHVGALLRAFRFNLLGLRGPELVVHVLDGDVCRVTRLRCGEPAALLSRDEVPAPDGALRQEPQFTVRGFPLGHNTPVLGFACDVAGRPRRGPSSDEGPRRFRLVYVTDAADTIANRATILAAARGADLFVCEASFTREHEDRARRTGHLTARAAAELAREADVGRLVPFHPSVRYQDDPAAIYREILPIFDRVVPPVPVRS